jgi:hypothetical protein
MLGYDLRRFRDRGLVRTGIHLDRHLTTSGIEYVKARNLKPGYMMLTRKQHRVLASLRREFRGDTPVKALPTGNPEGAIEVEWVLLLIRLIEELEDASIEELVNFLGCTDRQIESWSEAVLVAYDAPHESIDGVWPDMAGEPRLARLKLIHGGDTLRRAGLDLAGLFPYSMEEVNERLDLIRLARGELPSTDDRMASLPDIVEKLQGWRRHLAHQRS